MRELKLYSDQCAIVLNRRQARLVLDVLERSFTRTGEEHNLMSEIWGGLEEFAEPPAPPVVRAVLVGGN